MASFPYREPDIVRLAQDIATGLATHTEVFPSPPASPDEITQALAAYNSARESAILASANARQGTAAKDEALRALMDLMKADLRYAREHLA